MKSVSRELKKTIEKRTDFYQTALIAFVDGESIELAKNSFYISGNGYTDAAGSNAFPLGVALEKQITLSLVNDKEQFAKYDFNMAKVTVYCNIDLESGVTESILMGTYTVTQPEAYGSIIEVEAVDDMYKGDAEYATALTYPVTAREALADSCATCGVYLLDTTFANDDFVIAEMPTGITHRALWGMIAMIAGGNARMDEYNRLKIVSYDFSLLDRPGAFGGIFDSDTPYSTGDDLYGGDFNPWENADTLFGGTFLEMDDYHLLWKAKNLTVATDDVVITGVQTMVEDSVYLFGTKGYILSLSNQLIEQNPQDALDRIGPMIVGARFRPFEMDHIAYPLAEFGDVCYVVDRSQNVYQSIITDINFQYYGYTALKCSADSPIRNSSKYNHANTQAIVQARNEAKKQISEYDKAVQMLTNLMTQSFGVFKTEDVLEDGSTIYYMHNKPTVEESQTIWKMTADAFAVSTDGGQTWNAGLDSQGNAVLNVLSAIGIRAEWLEVEDLEAIGATIGGWKINKTQIYKTVDLYEDMTESGLSGVGDEEPVQYWVWVRSPTEPNTAVFGICYATKSDFLSGKNSVYPIFLAKADGTVTANTLNSKNANITGGSFAVSGVTESFYPISMQGANSDFSVKIGPYKMRYEQGNMYSEIGPGSVSAGTINSDGSFTDKASLSYSGNVISQAAYDNVDSASPNVVVWSNGLFRRSSSSSKKYKTDIREEIPASLSPERLYELPVKVFKYKDGYLRKGDSKEGKDIIGFVAEDFQGIYESAIQYDESGNPEMWNSNILIPAMLKLLQEQNKRISELEKALRGGK